jgi:hypothetical protein
MRKMFNRRAHRCGCLTHLRSSRFWERSLGVIFIVDYKHRSIKLATEALKERGHDPNNRPYALCGILIRPDGFDLN